MSALLPPERVVQRLAEVPAWRVCGDAIVRTYECGDFAGSIRFVNAVADVASAANHHPEVAIDWGRVTLTSTSHDRGGLTDRDFDLALRLDAIEP